MKPAATERNGVQFFIAAVTPNDLLYGRMIIHVKKIGINISAGFF